MLLAFEETAINFAVLGENDFAKPKVINAIKIDMVYLNEKPIEINPMVMVAHYDYHLVNYLAKEGKET